MKCPVCDHENLADARFCGSCGTPLEDESDVLGLVGQTIGGRYHVKRVIGEGGMGVVYEAEQQMGPTVRRVAVKTLLPWMGKDPTIRSRFYREGGTVSQLEHPNTVRVFDFGEAPDGRLYIAMEFVRGEPLTRLIDKGPVAPERALNILRQVCGALEEAHAQGIVHRDLKPDNIVLTDRAGEADFVKVLDFGIAAHTGPDAERRTKLTKQGMVLGTPPYMSPEQLAGDVVDARSDVYSLGIIAYEMLTGKLPFEADTPWQWAQKHMTERPRALTTVTDRPIPGVMEAGVLAALAKRPSERPASAMHFYRLLAGEPALPVTAPDIGRDRTTPMPAPPEMGGRTELGGVQPAFRTGAAVAAPIPPPPSRRRSGRWIGWALTLTGVGALGAVLVSVGVPSWRTGSHGTGGTELGSAGSSGTETTTEILPMMDAAPEPPLMSVPPPEPEPVTKAPPKKTPGKVEPPPQTLPPPPAQPPPAQPPPAQPPPAQPPPAQPPPAQPPPARPPPVTQPPPAQPPPAQPPPAQPPRLKLPKTPPAGPQGDQACTAATGAARGGNIEGAVSLYRTCSSTGGSGSALANTRIHIGRAAPGEVKRRAFLGNCNGARSAANAASSIGEGGPAQAALAQTSCK